jgi:hypothetical protein
MLATCTEPGCRTLVFGGGACLAHDHRQMREFVRGRPFVQPGRDLRATGSRATAALRVSRAVEIALAPNW